ncbi:lytic murein transglycosylase [Sphingomonas sp. RB56-2]|uniref:Lytic murein transglycosylase n=1 Tax=Sphingomonas brevis TaxID=2908206 RepID=A0ABT0S7A4_9SPHN|nr:lytic murein transglycosylase [Sphingomonas brevis]MCL6740290.1 lytic murein transglycosylase [Sphingomonas brevis]
MVVGATVKILSALAVTALASNGQEDPLAPLPEAQRPAAPLILQPPPVALPQPSAPLTGFTAYKVRLSALARSAGVRDATIQAVIPYLQLNGRVVQLDQAQRPLSTSSNAPSSFGPYISRHITSSLISRGYARYAGHWTNLSRIRERYGVEPAVVIAIYGKETSYGSITGTFDLVEALASLAYEGRRRSMFEGEFVAALQLLDAGVRRSTLKGSYAGATGYPQFMPSVALRLRADGDGDGYADIWRSEDDAFASIANYLRDAGWKPNLPWGVPVSLPANLDRAAIRSAIKPPRCPAVYSRHSRWLTVREWRAMGVRPADSRVPDNEMATLMETPGAYAQGYLLTTNYRSILDYNCSNYYALTIGLLADAISRRG